MAFAGTGVLGACGTARRTPGGLLAMPVQPPLWDLIDDRALRSAELRQSRCRRVDELAQRASQMATMVALEAAPLVLLGIEVWTVAGQRQHLQPRAACRQRPPRRRAGVAGTIVQHHNHVASGRLVPGI